MSFLGLSTWPVLLLSALTIALILTFYLLKPPAQRLAVSSLLLWSRLVRERRHRPERWRWWVSLLTALLVGLALSLGAGWPVVDLSGGSVRMVVVVDNGPSMATRRSDGRTRWEHAVEVARELIESRGDVGEVLVLDTGGRLPAAGFEDVRGALERLDSLEMEAGTPHMFPPLALQAKGAEVHFISDGVGINHDDIPRGTRLHSVFERADNVALRRLVVRPAPGDPERVEAFVELQSMAREPRAVKLRLAGVGTQRIERTVVLEPGQERGVVFDLSSFPSGPLRVAATMMGDALDMDNFAYGVVPERRRRRVVIVSPGNSYLDSYFTNDETIEALRLPPEAIDGLPVADVYVFDRCAPRQAPRGACLLIAPPAVSWLPSVVGRMEKSKVSHWERNHPVLKGVDLADLVVTQSNRYEIGDVRVLVGEEEEPLVLSAQRPVRWLLLAFALERSNFVYQAGFPIFLSRAVDWLAGVPGSMVAGLGPVAVPGTDVEVSTWEGEPVEVERFRGETLFKLRRPGLYVARRGSRRFFYVASNLEIADINRSGLPPGLEAPKQERRLRRLELWELLLGLAFVVLVAEWWAYHRRWTI